MSTDETKLYRHKYGGIYELLDTVVNKSSHDNNQIAYIQHIYPFEKKTLARNLVDFNNSHTKISTEEFNNLKKSKSQEDLQNEISERKKEADRKKMKDYADEKRKNAENIDFVV